MKRLICWLTAALLFPFLLSPESYASGFRLPDQSASAMGMAGAFVGQADDATAVWYNPAGITQLPGTRLAAGVTSITPTMEHDTPIATTETTERELFVPPHFYLTHRVSKELALGISVNSPFGLSTTWSDSSSVRYVTTFSEVKTIEVNPSAAYQFTDRFSAAFGIAYLQLKATMEKALPVAPGVDAKFTLKGDGSGWGFNAAMLFKATDAAQIGLTYRSRIKINLDGTADAGVPLSVSNPGKTDITLPDIIQAGVSYKATDSLTLNADLEYTLWSTYDRLVVTSNTIAVLTGGATDTQTSEKKWENAFCLRLGGQYRMNDHWKLRAGYVYDQNPVPENHFDTAVPDADRQGITIGAGYSSGKITVDVAYMYLKFMNRTIKNSLADDGTLTPDALNGTYRSEAQLTAITIGYAF